MRFPDRSRYRSFIKAYVVWYLAIVGLFIAIDSFSNLDEFARRADSGGDMFIVMIQYYLTHPSLYFGYQYHCCVILLMAATYAVVEPYRRAQVRVREENRP